MSGRLSAQRMHETHLIGQFAELREQVRSHLATLAARFELPGALEQVSLGTLRSDQVFCTRHCLAMAFFQFRFVIERVNVAAGPGAIDDKDFFLPSLGNAPGERQTGVQGR